ncbi:hypothetical protein V8F20_003156 [Naviculisporaceae sp. PSN 640]
MASPASTAPAAESRKRSADSADDNEPSTKRQKITPPTVVLAVESLNSPSHTSNLQTPEAIAKAGLRRSIALALSAVGFDSATPEAMESFVIHTEKYMASMIEEVGIMSKAARRNHPVPKDFETTLGRFNLTTSALRPHKKPPIPKSKRLPQYEPIRVEDSIAEDLPVLGADLNGASDKSTKSYIPSSFPAFPSIHTYRYTPVSVEDLTTVADHSLPDTQSQTVVPSQTPNQAAQTQTQPPLAPDEIPRGDPKKMREAAAKEAKSGEAALRGLMRASKIAKQKEVWLAAQQDAARRERYNQWESVMKDLMDEETKAKGKDLALASMQGSQKRAEIADHAMIVNADKRFYRREMPRNGNRRTMGEGVAGKG